MNQQEDDCLNNSSCNNNVVVNNELGRQEWDNFGEIPELPTGQTLRFELLSPWDDPTYIGKLSGNTSLTILFTTNEEILARIAEHDEQILQIPEQQQQDSLGDNSQQNLSVLAALQQAGFAAAGRMEQKGKKEEEENEENKNQEEENLDDDSCVGKLFHMELVESWGSADSIGLTGIQFLGPGFAPIDDNLAKDIWNYNASTELSYAGVRYARFYANGRPINGLGDILLRRAPGFVFFDFVQDVLFDRCPLQRPLSCARPQTRSVAAFIFQLRLLSTWGDEFYIGLNGIELFNRQDKLILKDDPRTSDKLIDGCNDTNKPYHMWLTPILPNSCARISADDLLLCSGAEVPASSAEATGILDIPLRDFEGE
uniref:KATNIP domain-containing protein n=1 Tax=Meloidogyne javanica TaxID=6303 RepID=A0A915MV68_MELJA